MGSPAAFLYSLPALKLSMVVQMLRFLCFISVGLGFAGATCGQEVINVYLMGGQSNMQGVGRNSEIPSDLLPQPNVRLYHSTGSTSSGGANYWIPNQPNGYTSGHFGPDIGLGARLSELYPDESFALIKHAVGGTDLNDDWKPGTRVAGPEYFTFLSTVDSALTALAVENPGADIRIRGMVWQQGEEDSKFESFADAYGTNLSNFIDSIRNQFDMPDMPFVYGTVHDVMGDEVPVYVYNDEILAAQFAVDQDSADALAVVGAYVVDASHYLTHGDTQDGFRDTDFAHFASGPMLDLGVAYADAFAAHASTVPEPSTCTIVGSGLVFVVGCYNLGRWKERI